MKERSLTRRLLSWLLVLAVLAGVCFLSFSRLTYSTFESYLPLALGYLIITLPISAVSRRMEKKFRYET